MAAAGIVKTTQQDPRGPGHFLSGGNDYQRDNEHITLKASAGALKAGTILGKQETGTPTVAIGTRVSGVGGTVGNGTVAVTADAGAQEGNWSLEFTTAGATAKFKVVKPDGTVDHVGTVGTPTTAGTVNVDVADGSNDFAAGDIVPFTVTYDGDDRVTLYGKLDLSATNGLEVAAGILWDDREDVAATQRAVAVKRNTPVNGNSLVYPTGATDAQKAAINEQLKKLGIIVNF